ncbi:MAG: phosphatase PAP2 family protein [Bacillota bacterium]|nr:phosphatase PAP2 family protein [Bacillota bacterium]
MNLKGHLLIAFFISLVSLIGFTIVVIFINDKKIIDFDSDIISIVQGWENPLLTSIMKFFTFIGGAPFVIGLSIVLVVFLYKVLKHRLELILFIAAVAGSAVINQVLKQVFHRVRPDLHRLIDIVGYSFPSGHAMNAFTVYGILTFLLWRHISKKWERTLLILFSIFFIFAIGISRIYLGVHFPSDIIGGYFASAFWLATIIWFFQYYKEKQYNRNRTIQHKP